MEKSKIVHQLALPQDAVDHICSFVFYSVEESTKRKRQMYSTVVREHKRVRKEELMSWGPDVVSSHTVYFVLPRSNQLILAHICSICGNYVKKLHCSKKIVCQCVV
jgi:hypothetical protein